MNIEHQEPWDLSKFMAAFDAKAAREMRTGYSPNADATWSPERLQSYYEALGKPMEDFAQDMLETLRFPADR